jgi:hypothetical protein
MYEGVLVQYTIFSINKFIIDFIYLKWFILVNSFIKSTPAGLVIFYFSIDFFLCILYNYFIIFEKSEIHGCTFAVVLQLKALCRTMKMLF